MKKFYNVLMCFVVIGLVLIVGAKPTMNYRGYCVSEGRYLSDNEFIREGVRHVLSYHKRDILIDPDTGARKVGTEYRNATDAEVEAFLSNNETCCSIGRVSGDDYEHQATFYTKITGRTAKVVVVNYLDKVIGPDNDAIDKYSRLQVYVGNCGHVPTG